MKAREVRQATPRIGNEVGEEPFLDFTSGYVQRALHKLPKQGDRKPWKLHQNYALDLMALKFGSVDDSMEFSNPEPSSEERLVGKSVSVLLDLGQRRIFKKKNNRV